jgi:hypothetical protein
VNAWNSLDAGQLGAEGWEVAGGKGDSTMCGGNVIHIIFSCCFVRRF